MHVAFKDLEKVDAGGGISLTDLGDGVLIVWLDRPEKLNALDAGFWSAMRQVLQDHEENGRAIVITGAGERAFSAGGDIQSFQNLGTDEAARAFQVACMETFSAVEKHPVPIIAAVNGIAAGGGCELTMACDIVLASEAAKFSVPEVNLGLIPGYGIIRGASIVGAQWLKYLAMTGEWIDAQKAAEIGLVQKITPPDRLLEEAITLAQTIAKMPKEAVAVAKKLVGGITPDEQVEQSIDCISYLHTTDEARIRRQDFVNRRKT